MYRAAGKFAEGGIINFPPLGEDETETDVKAVIP
jgi:hypothetical protein